MVLLTRLKEKQFNIVRFSDYNQEPLKPRTLSDC